MSFIYDDENLVNQLLKNALDFETKFTKEGQAAAASGNFANLEALLKKLESDPEVDPKAASEAPGAESDDSISYEGDGPAPKLTSTNLEGLGAFVDWLATNQMTIGGKRIAYHLNEPPQDQENYQLYKLEPNAGLTEVADRSMVKRGFYANKDLIVKFIVSRQAALAKKPNRVEEVQLGVLIRDANRLLDANISEQYKEPEVSFPDNQALDDVPNPLDPKQPLNNGALKIFVKDLKSKEALNAWLEDKNAGLRGQDGKVTGIKDQSFNVCAYIQALHIRASTIADRARPEHKKIRDYYVKLVEQVASQANCSLSGSSAGGAGGGGNKPTNVSAQAIGNVISRLPFSRTQIDFGRIKVFFETVQPLLNHVPQAATLIGQVNGLIDELSSKYLNSLVPIPLGLDWHAFSDLLKGGEQRGQNFIPALNMLHQIINGTRSVVDLFLTEYGNNLQPAEKNKVYEHTPRGANATCFYTQNIDALTRIRKGPTFK